MMAERTGMDDTLDFLKLVKENLTHDCKPWLAYDMHRSHQSRIVQDYV